MELVSVFSLRASVCLCWGVICWVPCDSQTAVLSPGHLFNHWKSAWANYLLPHSSHCHVPHRAPLISKDSLKLVFVFTQALHAPKQFGIWFVVLLRGYMNSWEINRLEILDPQFSDCPPRQCFEILPRVNSTGKFPLTSALDFIV